MTCSATGVERAVMYIHTRLLQDKFLTLYGPTVVRLGASRDVLGERADGENASTVSGTEVAMLLAHGGDGATARRGCLGGHTVLARNDCGY